MHNVIVIAMGNIPRSLEDCLRNLESYIMYSGFCTLHKVIAKAMANIPQSLADCLSKIVASISVLIMLMHECFNGLRVLRFSYSRKKDLLLQFKIETICSFSALRSFLSSIHFFRFASFGSCFLCYKHTKLHE